MWRQQNEQSQVKQLLDVHGFDHLETVYQPDVRVTRNEPAVDSAAEVRDLGSGVCSLVKVLRDLLTEV